MPKTKTAPPPAVPKVRGGGCVARCSCGNGRCDCEAFEASARLSDRNWLVCLCGHTQQIHQLIEVVAEVGPAPERHSR